MDFFIILAGRIIYVFLTVFSIRIMSTTLSEAEIGNYYLLIAIIFFFTSGLISPLGSYVSRNINEWKRNKNVLNALFIYALFSLFISLLSLVAVYLVFNVLNYSAGFHSKQVYVYIFLSVFVGNTHNAILGLSNIIGLRRFYIKYLILTISTGLIFAITLTRLLEPSAINWLSGIMLAELFLVSVVVTRLNKILENNLDFRLISSKFTKERITKIFIYSSPLFVVCILIWAQNYSYRFIIDYKYGLDVLALIGLGFSIAASIMTAFESIIAQYLNPIFYANITLADKGVREHEYIKNLNAAIPIYLLVALFIAGLAPFLIKLLVAQKFYNAYIYLMIGAWIELFKASINHGKLIFHSEYKNNLMILPSLISAALSLVAIYYIDLHDRYFVIGLILLGSYCLYIILIALGIKKIIKSKLLDIKEIIIAALFGLIFLTAQYFNDADDFSLLGNLKVLVIYGLIFIASIFQLVNMINKDRNLAS